MNPIKTGFKFGYSGMVIMSFPRCGNVALPMK